MLWSEIEEPLPTLPSWLGEGSDHQDDPLAARSDGELPLAGAGCTILVIDDDLANLALAEALLKAEGFEVRVAMDARSMTEALKSCTPSLILMDIQLPEVDGWELTRRLKSDPATASIPVIGVTAYGKPGDEAKAQEAGFVEFVSKPVSTRTLPGIIRRYLRVS